MTTTTAKPTTAEIRSILADAFRAAAAAAEAADPIEDGGTCNIDTPAFAVTVPRKVVEAAAADAGLTVSDFRWFGGRWYWLNVPLRGQGNRRSTMMEAAQKVLQDLKTSGRIPTFRACGWQQMD